MSASACTEMKSPFMSIWATSGGSATYAPASRAILLNAPAEMPPASVNTTFFPRPFLRSAIAGCPSFVYRASTRTPGASSSELRGQSASWGGGKASVPQLRSMSWYWSPFTSQSKFGSAVTWWSAFSSARIAMPVASNSPPSSPQRGMWRTVFPLAAHDLTSCWRSASYLRISPCATSV